METTRANKMELQMAPCIATNQQAPAAIEVLVLCHGMQIPRRGGTTGRRCCPASSPGCGPIRLQAF